MARYYRQSLAGRAHADGIGSYSEWQYHAGFRRKHDGAGGGRMRDDMFHFPRTHH